MTELKPCPFCGGQAHAFKTSDGEVIIYCENSFCASIKFYSGGYELAKKRWNTRAERKTKPTVKKDMTTNNGRDDMVDVFCEECHHWLFTARQDDWKGDMLAYCPHCGAKMVME